MSFGTLERMLEKKIESGLRRSAVIVLVTGKGEMEWSVVGDDMQALMALKEVAFQLGERMTGSTREEILGENIRNN
jgi:hypothetical protein